MIGRLLCHRGLHTMETLGYDRITASCWHVIAVCTRKGCCAGLTFELHRDGCHCPAEVPA